MDKIFLVLSFLLWVGCQLEPRGPSGPLSVPLGPDTIRKISDDHPDIRPDLVDYDTLSWTDLALLDVGLSFDLRYATTNNFSGSILYPCGRCFLRPKIAERLVAAHRQLQKQGYGGLLLFDCYRPRPIQWELWENTSDKRYVSDPRKGSMHNRGAAVDLTIVDSLGQPLDMGTDFDHFGPEAHWAYAKHPPEVQQNRRLLRETMQAQGFKTINKEWWHYSLAGFGSPLSDFVWTCP